MRSLTCQCCGGAPLRALPSTDRLVCDRCRTVHALAPRPEELPAWDWWPGVVIVNEYLVPA